MTSQQATRWILGCMAVTVAFVTVRQLRAGELPRPRVIAAAFVVGAGLAAVAEVAPQLAAGFAGLTAITAMTLDPIDVSHVFDDRARRRTATTPDTAGYGPGYSMGRAPARTTPAPNTPLEGPS